MGGAFSIVQDARVKLARLLAELGHNKPVDMPDISTKDKAQEYIGLDMDKLRKEKAEFKQNVVPKWLKEAKTREAGYNTKKVSMTK